MKEQFMKKVLVTLVLATVLATTAVLTQGSAFSFDPGRQATAGQDQTAGQGKQIKDPAEYNAYIAALNTQDAKQKAAAMMAFLQQYPNTIMKQEALEQARAAYQASGDVQKLEEVCRLILKDNPNDVQSLALVTAIDRNKGTPEAAAQARAESEKGLQLLPGWKKPEGTSDADFEKVKTQMTIVFNGAAGFGALQAKDYASAKNYYLKALQGVQLDPNNMQDVYQLAIAKLESNPLDVDGFWYAAKAIHLAGNNAQAVQSITTYAKSRHKKYHGGDDGWDQLVAGAATQNAPPPNFAASIKPAPTPCDLAVDAVKQNDPDQLSFSDREFILGHASCSPANKEAADKVWQAILAKQKNAEGTEVKLKLSVLVIAATKDTIQVALTDENKENRKADLTVVLEKPVLRPPAAGTKIDVVGVMSSYTPEPFMFTMEKGELPGAKAPVKPPVRRPAARKRARP
jgi:tetratricopeptide (TPR) repeat protein